MESFLTRFAGALTAATAIIIAAAICHEWGYFWIIGSRFQTFMSWSDYFGNAVLYLPIALFAAWGWSNDKYLHNPTPFASRSWRNWIVPGLFVSIYFLGLVFWTQDMWVVFFLAVWIPTWVFLVRRFTPAEGEVSTQFRAIALGVPICATLFGMGISHGIGDRATFAHPYVLYLKNSDGPSLSIMLRHFDRGLLVRDVSDNRIEFIKWDEIKKVSKISAKPMTEPLSCTWWGIWCSEEPRVP